MSSDEFWNGDPNWFLSYIEAYRLRMEREEEKQSSLIDYQAWLTGLYVHQGIQVALANSFSKNSHAKYVKEPISFSHNKEKKELTEKQEQLEMKKSYVGFKALVDAINRK